MKRRSLLLGILAVGALAAGGAVVSRPEDEGAPYDDYFRTLNAELRRNGPMRPCMVVDLDRLDHNIDAVTLAVRAPKKRFRVVAKSLPSAGLIAYVFKRAATDRLMSFHQPFLNADAQNFPDAEILLGKPLPARSAQLFYQQHKGTLDPARQIQWLIDTPQRLQQYLELANALGTPMRINIEIDVGLHRGGVVNPAALGQLLGLIAANPQRLSFAGFMGYDPHVVKIPRVLGTPEQLFADSMARYQDCVDLLRREHAGLWRDDLTFNGAGSPTYALHTAETLTNDLSVGSGLVKPTDFDVPTLDAHVPACFIATPVLKAHPGLLIPGLEQKSAIFSWWDPNQRETFFIYGGNWMANYESPRGLRRNDLFGHSSNQEIATASPAVGIGVDDHVFLRPTQSEAVFLQFGDLVAVRGGRIEQSWPVYVG